MVVSTSFWESLVRCSGDLMGFSPVKSCSGSGGGGCIPHPPQVPGEGRELAMERSAGGGPCLAVLSRTPSASQRSWTLAAVVPCVLRLRGFFLIENKWHMFWLFSVYESHYENIFFDFPSMQNFSITADLPLNSLTDNPLEVLKPGLVVSPVVSPLVGGGICGPSRSIFKVFFLRHPINSCMI